jgi:hypothetical protein
VTVSTRVINSIRISAIRVIQPTTCPQVIRLRIIRMTAIRATPYNKLKPPYSSHLLFSQTLVHAIVRALHFCMQSTDTTTRVSWRHMERTIPLTIYLFICFSPSVAIIVFIEMHLVLISNFILASAVLLAIYLPRPLGHCQNAD